MSLQELIDHELPLNRKERLYTGTVLPMLVCRENFRYLSCLTNLIESYEQEQVYTDEANANIQFFTEYGLLESLYGSAEGRFSRKPLSRDTPDLIILIKGLKRKVLIAIESKMYDVPTQAALERQMDNQQKRILDLIRDELKIEPSNVLHCALLPRELAKSFQGFRFRKILWEDLLNSCEEFMPNDYFVSLLRIALDRYPVLRARSQPGSNAEGKLTGRKIFDAYGTSEFRIMGRQQGLTGDILREDIDSGAWENQEYEVSRKVEPPNRNWFSIADFIREIEKRNLEQKSG